MAGFTAAPLRHRLLFSSLTKLEIYGDNKVKSFTEEQEDLLFVNSLEDIAFCGCQNLQSLLNGYMDLATSRGTFHPIHQTGVGWGKTVPVSSNKAQDNMTVVESWYNANYLLCPHLNDY
ncbi:unnamed protein product [Miscanthus lutarioriparius]|uniref:Uncharacterized protein n=1 Tax=Miscanthus lutarioriparius TaxID=422564 RepID=A0A811RA86_9POAL|nr:unnamed protein product [Miscanthus lutarioriparius]